MIRCLETAYADTLIIDDKDRVDLLKSAPETNISIERQLEILLLNIRAFSRDDTHEPTLSEEEQSGWDWVVEYGELQRTPSTKPRGDKMLMYRVAAALFNNALLQAQSHGYRLSEGPTNASALERDLNRHRKKTSVE